MARIDLEEKKLKKKLEALKKKYNENLFNNQETPLQETPLQETPKISPPEEPEAFEEISSPEKLKAFKQPEAFEELEIPKKLGTLGEKPKSSFAKNFVEKIFHKPKHFEGPLKLDEQTIKQEINQIDKKKTKDLKILPKRGGLSGKISPLEIKKTSEKIHKLKKEMSKVLVGQEEIVEGMIRGLLCNAHVLLEGVPGIAKTLAIRALAAASGCTVKRVQFTVDMLPTDITGITSYTPNKGFEVIKGPIFANFIIADEINRAPPKTQSALIEAMQEKQVTIGKETFPLPDPFFVMATENPIENAGVYPLPEAQIDRFLFKLIMGYPGPDEEKYIMSANISIQKFEQFNLKAVITPTDILKMQDLVKKVYLDDNVKNYILAIIRKTRAKDFENAQYISYGCSPRASIGLFIASKANALANGRDYVLPEDVQKVVFDVMRHRLILSYKASIQKISTDLIIKEILNSVSIE